MDPYDLAWKGTTLEEKRALFEHAKSEKERLKNERDLKNGYMSLASTCVDIINTAKSVINNSESSLKDGWSQLLNECITASKEAIAGAEHEKDAWTPNEYEVAGVIYIQTSDHDSKDIDHAISLFKEGLEKARQENNYSAGALILAQLVRADIAKNDLDSVSESLMSLHKAIEENKDLDPKVSTRLYRALAEGSKFLAIEHAKIGGSPNQELKAKAI